MSLCRKQPTGLQPDRKNHKQKQDAATEEVKHERRSAALPELLHNVFIIINIIIIATLHFPIACSAVHAVQGRGGGLSDSVSRLRLAPGSNLRLCHVVASLCISCHGFPAPPTPLPPSPPRPPFNYDDREEAERSLTATRERGTRNRLWATVC